jgi:hypothetical protein
MDEVAAVTVVMELPHDVGLDNVGVFGFTKGPLWPGWTREQAGNYVQFLGAVEPGRCPVHRIVFKRVRVRSRLPLYASDRTFGDWGAALLPRHKRRLRKAMQRLFGTIGLFEEVSVAAVTWFTPAGALPDLSQGEHREARIEEALSVLNDFLVCLGVEGNDPLLGPLARVDLPAAVPMLLETQPVPTASRRGISWLTPMHAWMPSVRRRIRDPAEVAAAAALFRAAYEKETVWFRVLELSHAARRDVVAGRYAGTVLTAATSVEVLVSTAVREVARVRNWSNTKIDGVLGAGFKNLLETHLPALLGMSIDLEDPADPFGAWYLSGYAARNAVVHAGHTPTASEAWDAFTSSAEVITHVGRLVESDPTVSHLGLGLPTGLT